MIIIRIQDLVLLHKNLPKIPLKSAKCMPQCWKYSQICCDVALAGIDFGNWTCELCSESCILHSDYPLNRVNQTLYFVIFLSFVHRILTHANGEYKTLMALQTSWRLQRKTRHAFTLFHNLPPERKFRIRLQKKNILHRLYIFFHEIFGNGHLDKKIKLRVISYWG